MQPNYIQLFLRDSALYLGLRPTGSDGEFVSSQRRRAERKDWRGCRVSTRAPAATCECC